MASGGKREAAGVRRQSHNSRIVVISVLWIPFIRNLNNEVFQYLQSVQAYVGAPITATFLVGILWRGATAPAALTTLITGGVIGGSRFLMDILHNAMKMDLGPINCGRRVQFSELQRMGFHVLRSVDGRCKSTLRLSGKRASACPPNCASDVLCPDRSRKSHLPP